MKRIHPAVTLLLVAPVMGELVSGHQPPLQFFNPIHFVVLALPYGCGALLCRELVRRWGKGALGMLLLSVAYGGYEEGIVSRALFDPQWRELSAVARAASGPAAGVNWTSGVGLIHFHAAISILASVMVTELIYSDRRYEPWLTNMQAVACGVVLALWPVILASLARAEEPLYVPGLGLWAVTGGMIVALILACDGVSLWLLFRWSGGLAAWDDRHRLGLVMGLVSILLIAGVLQDMETGS